MPTIGNQYIYPGGSVNEHPVRLVISDDMRRNRLTVFFRLILAIPHYFWLFIWGIGAFFAVIADALREIVGADWSPEIDAAWRKLLDEIERVVSQHAT